MEISTIETEPAHFEELWHLSLDENKGENLSTIHECVQFTETNSEQVKDDNQHMKEEYPQLTDPTYWISYEYQQILEEIKKLNEKMNLILSTIEKKPKKIP